MPSQVTMGKTDSSMIIYITQTQGGPNCVWTAQSSAVVAHFSWEQLGRWGPARFMIRAATNTGAERAATVTAGGRTLTVDAGWGRAVRQYDRGVVVHKRCWAFGRPRKLPDRDDERQRVQRHLDSARSQMYLSTTVAGAWQLRLQGPSGQVLSLGSMTKSADPHSWPHGQPGLDFDGGGTWLQHRDGALVIAEAIFGIRKYHPAVPRGVRTTIARTLRRRCTGRSGLMPQVRRLPLRPRFPPTPSTPTSFLNIQSGTGDPVGNGQTVSYTLSATTPFSAMLLNNGRELNGTAGAGFAATWSVSLTAPAGPANFCPGRI
jgi:hypothetical protein